MSRIDGSGKATAIEYQAAGDARGYGWISTSAAMPRPRCSRRDRVSRLCRQMLAEAAYGEYVDAMNCPACGHLNRADAKFCLTCGAAFVRVCPACGKQLPAEARFCDE